MRSSQHLDQIEPKLSEVLWKVDRLIDSNGRILSLAVNTAADLAEFNIGTARGFADLKTDLADVKTDLAGVTIRLTSVETTVGSTARAVANLTISTQRQYDELKGEISELRIDVSSIRIKTSERPLHIAHFRTSLSCTDTSEASVFAYVDASLGESNNSAMHADEPYYRR